MATDVCQKCPLLEVIKCRKPQGNVIWDVSRLSVDSLSGGVFNDSKVTIVYAQAHAIRQCSRCQQKFLETFKMPRSWWSLLYRRSNGYFGYEDTVNENGLFDGYNTWFRFLAKQTFQDVCQNQKDYVWYKCNVFTRWRPDTSQSMILIFDPPPALEKHVLVPLLRGLTEEEVSSDHYFVHTLLTGEMTRLQDEAVWAVRNLIRSTETQRTSSAAPNPNYPNLHDIARHAIHVSETIEMGIQIVKSMLSQHDLFACQRLGSDDATKSIQKRLQNRMESNLSLMSGLQIRSTSNQTRIMNEIQLAFNMVAQYDSHISVQIGRAAQDDSSAMKVIAFITLTFFPATFTSAIFSMSFFNYDPSNDAWTVSRKFWLFWIVALPLTLFSAGFCLLWGKFFPPKQIGGRDYN